MRDVTVCTRTPLLQTIPHTARPITITQQQTSEIHGPSAARYRYTNTLLLATAPHRTPSRTRTVACTSTRHVGDAGPSQVVAACYGGQPPLPNADRRTNRRSDNAAGRGNDQNPHTDNTNTMGGCPSYRKPCTRQQQQPWQWQQWRQW